MRIPQRILVAVFVPALFALTGRCEAQPTPLAFDAACARDAWTAAPSLRTIGLVPPHVLLNGDASGGAIRPLWVLVGMAAGAVVGGTAGTPPADPVFPYWPESNVRRQTILGAAAGALGGVAIPQGTLPRDPE